MHSSATLFVVTKHRCLEFREKAIAMKLSVPSSREKKLKLWLRSANVPSSSEKKLKLWLRSASVPSSREKKLKQKPLYVNVPKFGREKCMHRSSNGSDGVVLLILSCKQQ